MNYRYFVIADEDTLLGFRCAGLSGRAATNRLEAVEALKEAREKNAGIVIVTEELAALMEAEVSALRFSDELPMLVEIPGAQGPLPGRRSLAEVIREAIGVKV